ncbi:hypothetical protein EVAR_2449_1 [Eumeta japonica]|uniref:Uncharacterized protein n=1 Tax=Eumeta variegata TaxID=151549 RepID=A0A4C1SQW8_EUMVA|nr:hypothetical protein EVAR_2449_1 [Eumeta japonica]
MFGFRRYMSDFSHFRRIFLLPMSKPLDPIPTATIILSKQSSVNRNRRNALLIGRHVKEQQNLREDERTTRGDLWPPAERYVTAVGRAAPFKTNRPSGLL